MILMTSTDAKSLLVRLTEYHKSLENHLNHLTANFIQLENRWRFFKSASEGDYADQFRSDWEQTEEHFKDYINQAQKIKDILSQRVDSLAEFNRASYEVDVGGSVSPVTIGLSSMEGGNTKIKANPSTLRNNLGDPTENKIPNTDIFYPDGDYAAHHVVPGECADKSPLVRAAIEAGFNIDSDANGIYLPRTDDQQTLVQKIAGISLPKHSGYHKRYSSMIDNILEVHWQDMENPDPLSEYFTDNATIDENQKVKDILNSAIETIKKLMIDGTLDRDDMYKS